ncbi:MAG: ATP synthase F1 subunit delta [Fidelibacterota bacterium]
MPRRKSIRYARALLALAERLDAVDAVNHSLQILSDLFDKDSTFRLLFFTRKIEPSGKVEILSSVLGDRVHPIALEFLAILEEKREYDLLKSTSVRYERLHRQRTDRVFVTTVTSLALKEEEYDRIRLRLETSLKKRVDLKKEVDPQLIGGVKLRIGNTFLDGSVSNRLERLKDSLL